ncbi:MAG TPA: glycosyl hydrolase family 65 protein, partial [Acetobacteraceae bacterium]|nr:glycosyl hydrolase family 65 protein [Acetobacteraceae bacterium]
PLVMRRGTMLTHRRTLDMRRGLLVVKWRHRDPSGIVARIVTLRLVSQDDRGLGLGWLTFDLDRDDVEVMLEASFEAAGLGMEPAGIERELGVWRTTDGSKSVAMAGAAALTVGGQSLTPESVDPLCWTWRCRSVAGQMMALERLVAVVRSDEPNRDPGPTATATLQRARSSGGEAVLAAHASAWAARWHASDVTIEGAPEVERELRFAVYHLNSAANPDDPRVSIGARALTGDAYLGHVFWDTEIYLLPFYIATWPEAARALLMYRFHTLTGARANAAKGGWRGAQYAWESADTGEETTPDHVFTPGGQFVAVLSGKQEHHITADVAYAVWQYWHVSGDDTFLLDAGAEILLETARFWASRATRGADGKRHIRLVMGPDEYHEGVDDNAYTNVMARWNIARGLDVCALLRERWPDRWTGLSAQLDLRDTELARWREVAETLVTGLDPATGVIEQFAGFFALEPIDLTQYPDRHTPMDVQLGYERVKRTQVIKQADVVALLALLPEEFDQAVQRVNFRTYEPRCGHGSSLSRAMHAVMAARLGQTTLAYRYFRETAEIDLSPNVADSAGGVHIAALGGLWQAVVMGFGGVSLMGEHLSVVPQLPPQWLGVSFVVCWRGRRVRFRILRDGEVHATLEAGEPLTVLVHGTERVLQPAGLPDHS